MAYVIGSEKGKKKAEEMQVGETYTATDGSTWTKKDDGSISVKTSKGETFNNAYTPTSTNRNSQFTGSSNSVITNNTTQQNIKDQMNANSIAWWDADEDERRRLEGENQRLGSMLGGTVGYDPKTGIWGGTAEGTAIPAEEILNWEYEDAPEAYENTYDPQMQELLSQILNRDDFSYDVESDPLYHQYKEMYQREGERAMKNTLAEVAAGAGGMNTYAVTVRLSCIDSE